MVPPQRDTPGASGPFDVRDAPDDGVFRVDLGSVRIPVKPGTQLQVELSPDQTEVRAVHLQTALGQCTVSAYAAPPAGGLWPDVCEDILVLPPSMESARTEQGEWGQEIVGEMNGMVIRFIGVDGPGWMVRGVAVTKPRSSAEIAAALRDVMRGTIVVRGNDDLPDRTPLPITLPDEVARHL
ncbi:DUF3710 domain-containing protein [Kibdelosporangium aridum]|uniref:DUF3710 domain-containing protein n=1 Tax=Kibdelosporangium aridum TaxID=2030 RepID=A0A428Z180_KIBAR|nr:DUF3710 domain-containing protein [Kibdelosporangium aridum]RSM78596.1 DUF3710 domain-containing protein [Kibdelosporangium aridum]